MMDYFRNGTDFGLDIDYSLHTVGGRLAIQSLIESKAATGEVFKKLTWDETVSKVETACSCLSS
jgi:hypothetical protein